MPTFTPNGIVTYESCPVCQTPNIRVEHGKDVTGSLMHFSHCPECGDAMPIVCYDCPLCLKKSTQAHIETKPDTCPICSAPMYWEDCDVCGGVGHLDVYELDSLWYDPSDVETCTQCAGDGGWYVCPNYHNHPTEKDRTASAPASTTPAGAPAAPLAGRQQHRQRKEPL